MLSEWRYSPCCKVDVWKGANSMSLLIKNGRVINPKTKVDAVMDILVEHGIITKIAHSIDQSAECIIDAKNMWVVPGLIDVHVHLREPGFEHKETIESGTKSAAAGGFTTICAMPNTNPVVDNEIIVEYIKMKAEKTGVVNVLPIGSITKGQRGEELANIGQMVKAGICAISEDGHTVMNASLMNMALKYAKMFNIPVMSHCEDKTMASGAMNAGDVSALIGLKGIPREAEEVITARDIILARGAGASLHICHVSTEGAVQLIREAKNRNEQITAEVCPHHFALTDEAVNGYDTNTKMNPPLRTQKDVDSIKKALKENVIEIIATDHAPHHADDKNCEYENAAFGIVGLETAVPLCMTELVHQGVLSPTELIEKLTVNPAKLINLDKGSLEVDKIADITIIDPNEEFTIDVESFYSKGKNSPFHAYKAKGRVKNTIVSGKVVF